MTMNKDEGHKEHKNSKIKDESFLKISCIHMVVDLKQGFLSSGSYNFVLIQLQYLKEAT